MELTWDVWGLSAEVRSELQRVENANPVVWYYLGVLTALALHAAKTMSNQPIADMPPLSFRDS